MDLGFVEPAVAVEGLSPAVMSGPEGAFSMQVLGWEIAPPHTSELDEWVVVRIVVQAAGRTWSAQASPFTASALASLGSWAAALARGERVGDIYFDDPELELRGSSAEGDTRVVWITLRQRYVPDDLDDADNGFTLTLRIQPDVANTFASALSAQAACVPPGALRR
ncbi:MAG: WapI family immunity protein [Coriobacteriia bacterium]